MANNSSYNPRNANESYENVFMLRIIPFDTTTDSDQGLQWLVVKVSSQPDYEWHNLTMAISTEVTAAMDHEEITISASGGIWQLDFTDLWALWFDPGDWWNDMMKLSERNCAAVLKMMRERGHQDALSIRLLFQGPQGG